MHKDINQKLMGFIYSLNAQKVGNVEENGDVWMVRDLEVVKRLVPFFVSYIRAYVVR